MPGPGPGTMPCPYCEAPMECDTVDVGVGFQQCGPYHCDACGASEIGPEACAGAALDEDERRTGFYKRGRVSPHANTVGGVLVDYRTATLLYELGLLDEKPGVESATVEDPPF